MRRDRIGAALTTVVSVGLLWIGLRVLVDQSPAAILGVLAGWIITLGLFGLYLARRLWMIP